MRALLVAAALTSITPQHGIAGARIGMSKPAVIRALGAPRDVQRGSNDFGKYLILVYPRVVVTFQSGATVTSLSTTAGSERTRGVGVGSTPAQVAARVPGARCLTEAGYHHCYVGTWEPGRVVTDFALRRGRVARVTVGYVLD